jgi:hypothetical protein
MGLLIAATQNVTGWIGAGYPRQHGEEKRKQIC